MRWGGKDEVKLLGSGSGTLPARYNPDKFNLIAGGDEAIGPFVTMQRDAVAFGNDGARIQAQLPGKLSERAPGDGFARLSVDGDGKGRHGWVLLYLIVETATG